MIPTYDGVNVKKSLSSGLLSSSPPWPLRALGPTPRHLANAAYYRLPLTTTSRQKTIVAVTVPLQTRGEIRAAATLLCSRNNIKTPTT